MNAGTAAVLLIVVIIVALAVRALVKKKGHGCCGGGDEDSGCGCNCSGCEGKAQIYGINVDASGQPMDSTKSTCPHCSGCN